MLSNYMFGILVILLIIVIIVMYYLWNETKKNKNEISILQSDMNALREGFDQSSKKIEELESFDQPQSPKKSVSKMSQQNILEHLMGNMNGFNISDFMRSGEEEEETEYESSDEEESEEEASDEDESEEEASDEEESEEEVSDEDESGEEESGEEEASGEEESDHVEEESYETVSEDGEEEASHEVEEVEEEVHEVEEVKPVEEESKIILMEEVDLGKKPIQAASNFEEGHVERGGDKRMYVVALNKKGVKYWKVSK